MMSISLLLLMIIVGIFGFIFFKHKSETFVVFQEFKALVENEYGKIIKTLRTQNVGEYT